MSRSCASPFRAAYAAATARPRMASCAEENCGARCRTTGSSHEKRSEIREVIGHSRAAIIGYPPVGRSPPSTPPSSAASCRKLRSASPRVLPSATWKFTIMNVPLGAPSPIVAARLRARREIQAELVAGLERNRRAVAAHAAGGGGHQAHLNGTTTHGHIWLLPEEMRRPWRANMVGRPRTATADTSGAGSGTGGELQVMRPLNAEQLRQLRCQYAITSADALPADECAICYQHFELPIVNQLSQQACIVRLPCGGGHAFHFRCIEPWMSKGRLCPTYAARRSGLRALRAQAPRAPCAQARPSPPAAAGAGRLSFRAHAKRHNSRAACVPRHLRLRGARCHP